MPRGIADTVFWEICMPLVRTIIYTDYKQTDLGFSHWQKLCKEALVNKYVPITYSTNSKTHRIYCILKTEQDIINIKNAVIGFNFEYQMRGLAIVFQKVEHIFDKDVKITKVSVDKFIELTS